MKILLVIAYLSMDGQPSIEIHPQPDRPACLKVARRFTRTSTQAASGRGARRSLLRTTRINAMKLTKEQKNKLAEDLNSPWGVANLLCDGYKITLRVERCKGLTSRVVTYINGRWRGEWCCHDQEFPEQKFLNKRTHRGCSPSFKAKAEKIFGKRAVAKDPFYSKTFVTYDISWPSGKAAINHLCRVCESVEIVLPVEVGP